MIKAVLFDMDGLIFDTESIYKKSWQFAAKEQGLELTDEFYQQFFGVQDPECEAMLEKHFGDRIDMTLYKRTRDTDFQRLREQGIAMKPGFDALFQAIRQRDLKLAIVTSSYLSDVQHNFRNTEYLEKYDLIVTAEDVDKGKPSPDCYMMAYNKLGIEPHECLVLEDSNNGVRSGLAAQCQVIMVPDLLPADEDNKHVIQVATLEDVIPYLDSL
ncbi:HAD family hydrolase [Vibrio sp. TBV020]|uniref:HAD family hydrolase n=1 Tax=Vibrio sp. TBV020 TaxID=3137398 RepID=UPI0038CD8B74